MVMVTKTMTKKIKEYVVLQEWFPANDPIAANVARLCILKEDLELEYRGWREKKISELDVNKAPWRKLYFLRNIFKTMMEIHSAVHSLRTNRKFGEEILRQPKPLRDAFDQLSATIHAAQPLIKDLRNAVGGHVREQSVLNVLNKLSKERSGFLEIDVARKQYHLNFALELCMAIIFDQHSEEQQLEKGKEIIGELKKALPFRAIDAIMTAYVHTRKLMSAENELS